MSDNVPIQHGGTERQQLLEHSGIKRKKSYCRFCPNLKDSLSDIIDADFGLLEKLRAVLTDRQYDSLYRHTGYSRNDELMKIVNTLPEGEFFRALEETGQQHVINYINKIVSQQEYEERHLPLSDVQRKILRRNTDQLANLLDLSKFLNIIFETECITRQHYDYITVEKLTPRDRITRLLMILIKRSQADYNSVVDALRKSEQGHLAEVLSNEGVLLSLRAEFCDEAVDSKLEAGFQKWKENASPGERRRLWAEMEQNGPKMTLVAIKKVCSVDVYIYCTSVSDVLRVDFMLDDKTLQPVLEAVFAIILEEARPCKIEKLQLNVASYNSCLHFYYSSMGCYDQFVVCDPHDVAGELETWKPSLRVEGLPLELLEIVLVRATILIFTRLLELLSCNADGSAVATVFMVCQYWHHVLTERRFMKEKIKKALTRASRPIRLRIRKKRSLTITDKDGRELRLAITGVATLNKLLFVVTENSSAVRAFDLTSFIQLQSIELDGLLKDPADIAACEVTRRIYIAEHSHKRVWRIDWLSPPQSSSSSLSSTAAAVTDDPSSFAAKFIDCKDYRPWKISTTDRRRQLLVTGDDNALYVYDVDGKLLRRVDFSSDAKDDDVAWHDVQHAVQATTGDSYFVCRLGRQRQRPYADYAEVVEHDSTGQRLRCYYSGPSGYGLQQVNWPVYLALIGDEHLLVADRHACRVLMLNTELKLERVLLTEQQLSDEDDRNDDNSWPRRLRYNSQTGLLCVGMYNGRVKVFKIC